MLSFLITGLRRLVLGRRARFLKTIPRPGRFKRILARERQRSDRSGDRFSLAVFEPPDVIASHQWYERLARLLKRRLRSTDEIGWLDRNRIAALLPATPPRGAWKVAHDIRRHFPGQQQPHCRVYCYPSDPEQMDRAKVEAAAHRAESDDSAEALELLFMRAVPLWKRTIDIAGASIGLALLSPFLVIFAAAIKLTSSGPVFYGQLRRGRGGRPFRMYKFRSMVVDADNHKSKLMHLNEQDGPAFKIKNDPRITRIGRFLRDTSIDELPQLWNVLRGDMSLVGPRPLPCDEQDACTSWQQSRLDVTPGLTCIWQVRGRSQVTFNEWVRMDLEYIRRRSLWQDAKILLATVPAVLLRRGAQ